MSSGRNFDVHAFCALPLVRRAYSALVAALAAFLLTLVVLHEPFRGYLAEVDIAGPPSEGLNLDDAVAWLKQLDPQAAAIAVPAGEISPKSQIRATYVARLPAPAEKHLDDLAQRWLYQYLPDRLQSYRRSVLADLRTTVQQAREREDAADQQLEALRQTPVVEASRERTPKVPQIPATPVAAANPPSEPTPPTEQRKARERLEQLRLELSRMMVSCTDAHPQVITLRSQIAALERELGLAPGQRAPQSKEPELISPATNNFQSGSKQKAYAARRASHLVSISAAASGSAVRPVGGAELATLLDAAVREKAQASRERQAAEHRLSDRLQELSSQPTAAQWSASRARVVTRLGGTPRSSILLLGAALACLAGGIMFRAAAVECGQPGLHTSADLASALALPIIGDTSSLRSLANRIRGRWYAASVWAILYASEAVLAIAAISCLAAMLIEPALARQVFADPFGTLSEVMERFGA